MSEKEKKRNPNTFFAIGICFLGAGVALSIALESNGAPVVGIGLIGVGIMFMVIAAVQKRKMVSGRNEVGDQDQPPE